MNKIEALKTLGFSIKDEPSEKEVKKAFKKKAVKLHPDVNKSENAETEFKKLNAAQDFLINPPPEPTFGGVAYTTTSSSSPHGPFGRRVRVQRGIEPIFHVMRISFRESVLGCQKEIKVDKSARCASCICSNCNGAGSSDTVTQRGSWHISTTTPCRDCKGAGRNSEGCLVCSGEGTEQTTSEFSIKIPGGILSGHGMRLRGFGNVEAHNGILMQGDIILRIEVEPEQNMRISGIDVISNIDISLLEALQGTTKKVKTALGNATIKIRKNTKHKDVICVSRHGVEKRGGHIFVLSVQYPKETDKLIETLQNKVD